ncbi:MAG: tRNA (adenosine(37)-N6)-dimethylallyltransferase MiaA [Verrucomicrobiota bacterium]|nr:tRNA (adenosine(37)-N6)-dimethylallyltransferase MiaA [Verrucomicrobiota bacterium]
MEDRNLAPGFFVVGPTAVGKTEIAIEVARRCEAEIVGADAFQIYRGLDLLTAKPNAKELALVRHHLIGLVPLNEEMNAEKFRRLALSAMRGIRAVVVGGNGMYVKALTDGLSPLPKANSDLRERLNQFSERELFVRLQRLDPKMAQDIDAQNKRRLIRALEICLVSGRPASAQRQRSSVAAAGVFVFRDRDDLYERINSRVEKVFAEGVVDEVRAAGEIGPTASQTLGLRQIRDLIAGKISERDCIAAIQQATRRYAKRQLTWFRRQSTFEPLNLSRHGSAAAIEWITRKARLSFAQQND